MDNNSGYRLPIQTPEEQPHTPPIAQHFTPVYATPRRRISFGLVPRLWILFGVFLLLASAIGSMLFLTYHEWLGIKDVKFLGWEIISDKKEPVNGTAVQDRDSNPSANTPSSPSASPTQTPGTSESTPAYSQSSSLYTKNAIVIKYFPLKADGKTMDMTVTGDVGGTYQEVRQRTIDQTNRLVNHIAASTTYRGYTSPGSTPSIKVNVVQTYEYKQAFPVTGTAPNRKFDYQTILTQHDICGLVKNQNVSEVFVWAYSGHGSLGGDIQGWESNMAGPYGDFSNSYHEDDMPKCSKTYVTYVLNYGRGTAEALHSWGHQIENEMMAGDYDAYMAFRGPVKVGSQPNSVIAHCGDVHHAPNSITDYDWANRTPHASDCLNLTPGKTGVVTQISCTTWGCDGKTDTDNPQLNYITWLWQNLPGAGNTLTYQGRQIGNMWQIHADFDAAMAKISKPRVY